MVSADPLKGFALLAGVAILSITTATVRLIAQTWTKAVPDRAPPASVAAMPPTATAAADAPDPAASPAAAAAMAKGVVERSLAAPTVRILEPVIARRIDGGSFVNGVKRARYETEVVVGAPRGSGVSIRRKYFITLQYVGGGEWMVERTKVATKY
jgi:hypothetical protein